MTGVTFFQLGRLAEAMGRSTEVVTMMAVCYLINHAIGHGDAVSDFQTFTAMTDRLGYTEAQRDALLRQVAESYQADRGQALLRAAFPEA